MTTSKESTLHVRAAHAIADAWNPFVVAGMDAGEFVDVLAGLPLGGGALEKASFWRHGGGELEYARPHSAELIYLIDGRVRIESSDGERAEASAGDCIYVPQGFTGTWTTIAPVVKLSISVTPDSSR